MDELTLDGKAHVSAKRAGKLTGYTKDYIGQLCRSGKLPARMVGRNWYIEEEALRMHKKSSLERVQQEEVSHTEPPVPVVEEKPQVLSEKSVEKSVTHSQSPESKTYATVHHMPKPVRAGREGLKSPSSYSTRTIEEAFPMRYEVDKRPLMPVPVRTPRATIDLTDLTVKEKRSAEVEPNEREGGQRPRSLVRPSSYVADARAVLAKRYGPKKSEPIYGHIQAEVSRDVDDSPKRESHKKSHISSSLALASITMIAVVAAALLYASLVVEDRRSYEQGEGGAYELRSQDLNLF